mgnify:FL=1
MTNNLKILTNFRGHYDDALERHYNFQELSEDSDTNIFLNGLGNLMKIYNNEDFAKRFETFKNKIHYNHEQPCAWTSSDIDYMKKSADTKRLFSKIYTICPYSADWLNEVQGANRFVPTYFPFNESQIVHEKEEKVYDTIYWGGVHGEDHMHILDTISKFKHHFFTLGPAEWIKSRERAYYKYITHTNAARSEMWKVLRKTKVNVLVNLLHLKEEQKVNIKNIGGWEKNKAFSHVDEGIVPQFKTRPIESAVNRTLMLVKKDPWNVIEYWFKPEEHFLYYEDNSELEDKVRDICNNWNDYEHIVENAFNEAVNKYTTKNFILQIKEDLNE